MYNQSTFHTSLQKAKYIPSITIIDCYTFQLRYKDLLYFAKYEQYFMSRIIHLKNLPS